jgi:hypothetical protein
MDREDARSTPQNDVPEADLVEQQQPALPDDSHEAVEQGPSEHIPPDAAEADYLEQHVSALPGRGGRTAEPPFEAAGAGASEADLAEQALTVPLDEEEYPFGTAGYESE